MARILVDEARLRALEAVASAAQAMCLARGSLEAAESAFVGAVARLNSLGLPTGEDVVEDAEEECTLCAKMAWEYGCPRCGGPGEAR